MSSINEELDKIVLKIFDTLEQLYIKHDMLEQVMKEGFLGISRSRYLLGMKRVSADQILGANLEAIYTTKIDDSLFSGDWSSPALIQRVREIEKQGTGKLFELVSNNSIETSDDVRDKLVIKGSDSVTGLRKRNLDSAEKETDAATVEGRTGKAGDTRNEEKHEKSDHHVNGGEKKSKPSSAFGILIPQSLQSSEKCFYQAVTLSVAIAELQCMLNLLYTEFKKLRSEKST